MSPNNKQNLSKDLENEIQNTNLSQFAHFSSDEDDERVLTNGYMLLNQDLEQANGDRADDSSSDFESDSSDEEIPADQLSQMVRCSVNVDFQENLQQAEAGAEGDREENGSFQNSDVPHEDRPSRFRSYLDNQLQEVTFEREYDKKENVGQQNDISLDKGEKKYPIIRMSQLL